MSTHTIAEGDKVVVFTNTTETMKGLFMFAPGVKPTGKEYSFQTADPYRIENAKWQNTGMLLRLWICFKIWVL